MEELKFIMTKFNIGDNLSEEEIEGMLLHADMNGDGHIDYNGELLRDAICQNPEKDICDSVSLRFID